ncbi:MAG: sugar transferase [Solirubrobacterales bacterium]
MWALAPAPAWVLVAKLLGLYDRDHRVLRHLTSDELVNLIAWGAAVAGISSIALSLTPSGELPIGKLLGLALALVAADLLLRSLARYLIRRITPPARCLVVGDSERSAGMVRKFDLLADMHMVEAGVADESELEAALREDPDRARIALQGVDRVILAAETVSPELLTSLSQLCRETLVKLSVVSPIRAPRLPAPRTSQLADLRILEFDVADVSRSTLALKRTFDMVAAALAVVITAPLFPLLALAIKLDSRGPVLFKQTRAGMNGPFRLYKFRTMRRDAASELEQVVPLDELDEPMFKLRRDPRLTRVGRILRRLSLDELPQLFNVLKGDMSVVGPRPEQVDLVDRYTPEQRRRLEVKPGITGPMQVYGRGDLTFSERLSLDLDYIENLSLARDVRILLLTLRAVVGRNGAY